MGKNMKNAYLRFGIVAISILIQAVWLTILLMHLKQYSMWISVFSSIMSVVVVLGLNSKHVNAAMKTPWIMLILVFPVMGLCMYLLFVIMGDPGVGKKMRMVRADMADQIRQNPATMTHLEMKDISAANDSRYLWNCCHWPVYENTAVTYYPRAVQAFEALKQDLHQAESFIFLQYFIIEDSSCFRELEEILVEKAKQGVEVRLLYDDFGSMGYVDTWLAKRLNQEGVLCRPFNPAIPMLNLFMNHRNHRKILVVDGKVGHTGGYNLAEAYFDRAHPYGDWKDNGIRLEGEAVCSLTAAFLEMWSVQSKSRENYDPYMSIHYSVLSRGYVQPFADNPLDSERTAENIYLNLTSQATRTLYFMTPYLIITDDLSRTLQLAAMRGVDVRIITPGIPDKKMVYAVTRSYYAALAGAGVRIYEYTPGFCHVKQCICDGKLVSIGTSNLDYRSLYHHFENNVLLYDCQAIEEIAKDFEETFPLCQEVTEQYRSGRGAMLRIWQYILRVFAPLM